MSKDNNETKRVRTSNAKKQNKNKSSDSKSKKEKKTKFKNKHPKAAKIIKISILVFILLAIIGSGILVGAFVGIFGDELKIDESMLKVGSENSTVYDADGNEVHDILVNIEGSIQAGSLPSPSTSSVSITLNSTAKSINLDNLKLIFKASCPPAYQGVVINKRQGLEIRNLKIGLPEGVSLNLDELLDSEN